MSAAIKLSGSGYRAPTPEQWRKIVRTMRSMFPLDFPVSVMWSPKAPSWAGKDWAAGTFVEHSRRGRVLRARVWINSRQQRNSAVDSLHHEWAHLMCEEEAPNKSAAFLHDDRFWTNMGKVYRTWHRET